jgi:hypothetical protein
MRRFFSIALILLSLPFLSGCGEHEDAKEIARLRKNGEVKAARQLAIQSLSESDKYPEIWRELAFADLKMVSIAETDAQAYQYLTEASILVAAMIEKQKLDHLWEGIASIAAQALRLDVNEAIQEIKTTRKTQWVDPEAAKPLIRRCQFNRELLSRIRTKDTDNSLTIATLDERLKEWSVYTDVNGKFMEDTRKKASDEFTVCYSAVCENFTEHGHFDYVSVAQQRLKP